MPRLLAAVLLADGMVVVTGPEQHAASVRAALIEADECGPYIADDRGWASRVPGSRGMKVLAAEVRRLAGRADELAGQRNRVGELAVDASLQAHKDLMRAEAAEAALRSVAAQPHAPADGAGTDGAVHLYVQGHPMGCPICQALEAGLA